MTIKSTRKLAPSILIVILCLWGLTTPLVGQQPKSPLAASFEEYRGMKENTHFKLEWVPLGPTVNSARADVVQVDPSNPAIMYVGFGSGGLWKTTNHGVTWDPIFEEQSSSGIGDVALAPSDPSIIYLGTGEHLKKPRNFTLPGTGIYRSDDAGKTWKNIGLEDSWSIAEIAVHPTNPEVVLVCVLGHLWSKNKNRGLYRTTNGGKTWEQVLYKNEMTGANDIVISPSHPNIMYASLWEVYPGISGKNSGIYHSSDGGKTWSPSINGLPTGPLVGRIGLAVSYTNPRKAYALIDNLGNPRDHAAELYKTVDGGLTWAKTHDRPFKIFPGIGWYFTDVYISPMNDEEVYCLGVRLAHTKDGGRSFDFVGGKVVHVTPSLAQGLHLDHCELWIDPVNPDHLALGNDGGLYVSYDRGVSWVHYNNIPTGEFYDITIDPSSYTIFGGTQDDATVYGPPKELNPQFPDTWKYLWIDPWDGGDGCVTQVDPDDNKTVYFSMQHGNAKRLDMRDNTIAPIMPVLPNEIKDTLFYQFIAPYFISPHSSKTLYHGGNFIFKSTDRGDSWKVISPNLSVSQVMEKKSVAAGALVESKIEKGLLYAGMDRGLFWVTKNDGKTWEEHSSGLANNYIRSICPSRFASARVYLTMTGLNYDDLHSYVYASDDYGQHWKSISRGLPNEPSNVILEDPTNENILYVGSLRGVYVSINRGKDWSYLGLKMPGVAIADLEIHEPTMDLIAGTHGRGIFKINIRPIQEMAKEKGPKNDRLFETVATKRPWLNPNGGKPDYRTAEKADIAFWLKEPKQVKLSLKDSTNTEVWSVSIPGTTGFNQYRWNLMVSLEQSDQPYFIHYEKFAKTGIYELQLKVEENQHKQHFVIMPGTESK